MTKRTQSTHPPYTLIAALCPHERQQPAMVGGYIAAPHCAGSSAVFCWGVLLLGRSFVAPGLGAVLLRVLHLSDNLASLAARVVVVRVRRRLQLGTTFSTFSRHKLVLLHVVLF